LDFGLNVRAARLQHGLTQVQLAAAAKLSVRHVREIERGRANVSLHAVERIARALSAEAADLFNPGDGQTTLEGLANEP
jgi:XRE family aerobic/anaerobic benzoate catabolism transcriptional regulator